MVSLVGTIAKSDIFISDSLQQKVQDCFERTCGRKGGWIQKGNSIMQSADQFELGMVQSVPQ